MVRVQLAKVVGETCVLFTKSRNNIQHGAIFAASFFIPQRLTHRQIQILAKLAGLYQKYHTK